jgi:hypothetical protein
VIEFADEKRAAFAGVLVMREPNEIERLEEILLLSVTDDLDELVV